MRDILIGLDRVVHRAQRGRPSASALAAGTDDCRARRSSTHDATLTARVRHSSNGTAGARRDFDDSLMASGHAGAVWCRRCEARAKRHNADVTALLGRGVLAVLCPASVVVRRLVHNEAGFHPDRDFGAMGAAAGVSAALASTPNRWSTALAPAAHAGGLIEYLADRLDQAAASSVRLIRRSSRGAGRTVGWVGAHRFRSVQACQRFWPTTTQATTMR